MYKYIHLLLIGFVVMIMLAQFGMMQGAGKRVAPARGFADSTADIHFELKSVTLDVKVFKVDRTIVRMSDSEFSSIKNAAVGNVSDGYIITLSIVNNTNNMLLVSRRDIWQLFFHQAEFEFSNGETWGNKAFVRGQEVDAVYNIPLPPSSSKSMTMAVDNVEFACKNCSAAKEIPSRHFEVRFLRPNVTVRARKISQGTIQDPEIYSVQLLPNSQSSSDYRIP